MLLLSAGFTILALSENGNVSFWRKMLCSGDCGPQETSSSKREGFCKEVYGAKYGAFSLSCCAAPFSSFLVSSLNLYVDDTL